MTLRVVTYILATVFAASGIAKLLSLEFELEAFARWGYPISLMYVTGALELAGAIGLLIRQLSALAALCLAALMLGALATHAMHAEWPMFAVAMLITSLAAWRAWAGRAELKSLAHRQPS